MFKLQIEDYTKEAVIFVAIEKKAMGYVLTDQFCAVATEWRETEQFCDAKIILDDSRFTRYC